LAQPATHTASRAWTHKRKRPHPEKSPKQVAGQVKKKRGQQGIDSARAREIQEALIRRHYLEGEPTGVWDSSTQAAMQRFQADQGWQSKTTPDSRALIKLGLGPNHDGLLNPESAITTTTTPTTPATAATAAGDPKAADSQSPPQDDLPK
jgi:peptidoglycan hydrolase-like protein with peptidoglycan-binding domain